MPHFPNRFAAFTGLKFTGNQHSDSFEAPDFGEDFHAPAAIAARLDSFNRFGTSHMAFAGTDDPNNPKGLPMGRPGAAPSRPQSSLVLSPESAAELETRLTDEVVNDETALELAKMLVGIVCDRAGRTLEVKRAGASDQVEAETVERELRQLESAMATMQVILNMPGTIHRIDTKLKIRGVRDYISAKPSLHKKFDVLLAKLSKALNIDYTPFAKTPAGTRDALRAAERAKANADKAARPKEKIIIDLDRTPLELFNNLSWEEICTLCGFSPRDYQEEWFQRILLRAKLGFDRGYVGAPTQTGKTFASFPIAAALAAALYPEKTILFVVKEAIVKQDMIDAILKIANTVRSNLRTLGKANLSEVKLGVIDADRKDLGKGYDIVIASLGTISRAEHLEKINPDNYGVVATDECVSLFTNQGQSVLRRFGFVDDDKNITPVKGRFVFGMSADAGVYDFTGIFGENARVDNMDMTWYIGRKNLHEPIGLDLNYQGLKDDAKWTVTALGGAESEAIPADVQKAIENIYDIWVGVFHRQKIIVPWTRIAYAEAAEAYFNMREEGSAYAYHSKKDSGILRRKAWLEFVAGSGAKVMHATNGLSVGARAKGVAGMIFPWQTNSFRRYGQWVGRMLGIHDTEEAAQKLIVQMTGWRGVKGGKPIVTLARYLGLEGYEPIVGERYRPLVIKSSGARKPLPTKFEVQFVDGDPTAIEFVGIPEAASVVASPKRFQKLIKDALDETFNGDLDAMAAAIKFNKKDIENFIFGQMPKDFATVKKLARAVAPNHPGLVTSAWMEDFLDIWQAGFPLSDWPQNGSVATLTRFLRRESLMAEFDEDGAAFSSGHIIESVEAADLKKLLRGEYVDKLGNLEVPEWLVLVSGIVKAQRDLDQNVVDETLAAAALEIEALAKDRGDREDQRQRREKENITAKEAPFFSSPQIPSGVNPKDLYPNTGEISIGRKAMLYYRLQYWLPDLPAALLREFNKAGIHCTGDYILADDDQLNSLEELDIHGRRGKLDAVLAELGLARGMNVRGWSKENKYLSPEDQKELFPLLDKPVAELGLSEVAEAELAKHNVHLLGDIWSEGYLLDADVKSQFYAKMWAKFELGFHIFINGWVAHAKDREDQRRRREEERAAALTINQPTSLDAIDPKDLFPTDGEMSIGRKALLFQRLNRRARSSSKVTNGTLKRDGFNINGHYVTTPREILDAIGGQSEFRQHSHFEQSLLEIYGLFVGMNVRGWTRENPQLTGSDLEEFYALLERPVTELGLSDADNQKLAEVGITQIGDLLDKISSYRAAWDTLDLGSRGLNLNAGAPTVSAVLWQKFELPLGQGLDTHGWKNRKLRRAIDIIKRHETPNESDLQALRSLLQSRVSILDLSVRSAKCFKEAGIETIAALVSKSEAELLKIKNFNRKCLNDIKELLADIGLELGMKDFVAAVMNPSAALAPGQEVSTARSDLHKKFDKRIEDVILNVNLANKLKEAGLTYIGDLVAETVDSLLTSKHADGKYKFPGIGRKSINEILSYLDELGLNLGMDTQGWRREDVQSPHANMPQEKIAQFHAVFDRNLLDWIYSQRRIPFVKAHALTAFCDTNVGTGFTKLGELLELPEALARKTKGIAGKTVWWLKEGIAALAEETGLPLALGMDMLGWDKDMVPANAAALEAEQSARQNAFLAKPVAELKPSGKLAQAFRQNGIAFVWQFAHLSENEFLQLPHCDKHSLKECRELLAEQGLGFETQIKVSSAGAQPMTPEEILELEENGIDVSMNTNLYDRLDDFDVGVSTSIAFQNIGLDVTYKIVEKSEDELREILKNTTKDSSGAVRRTLVSRIINEIKIELYRRGLRLGTKVNHANLPPRSDGRHSNRP